MVKSSNILLFTVFIINLSVFGQGEKLISGKIITVDASPAYVHVVNLVNEKEAISDTNGNFVILAKPDDVLVFSAKNLDYQRKIIEKQDYDAGDFTIKMTAKTNELEEVKVVRYNMNAVNMGILQKAPKSYTPAERRLKTAGDFKPLDLLGILGGTLPLDPIINAINGRTAQMKKNVKVEQRELWLVKTGDLFQDSFFIENLKIPEAYVKGFKYYIIEDAEFINALKADNEMGCRFIMSRLAVNYKTLLENEKK